MKCGRRLGRGTLLSVLVHSEKVSVCVASALKIKRQPYFRLIEVEPWSKAAFRNEKIALEGVFFTEGNVLYYGEICPTNRKLFDLQCFVGDGFPVPFATNMVKSGREPRPLQDYNKFQIVLQNDFLILVKELYCV